MTNELRQDFEAELIKHLEAIQIRLSFLLHRDDSPV